MTTAIDILIDKPGRNSWKARPYKPTREEEDKIRDAFAYVVIKCPFFAYLLYNETTIVYTLDVPWAATDHYSIMLNPQSLNKWDIATVAFVIVHELMHKVYCDLFLMHKWREEKWVLCSNGRRLPYIHQLMNKAQDFRINAGLIEAKIGTMPPVGCFDPAISAKGMESSVEIYEKLYDENGGSQQPDPDGDIIIRIRIGPNGKGDGKSFDIHLEPPKEKPLNQDKHDQIIAAAAIAAEASGQGSMPAALRVLIGEMLHPKVYWGEQLKSACLRSAGDPAYDWSRVDRRLLVRPTPQYFAKPSHYGAGIVCIGYDTSGSCVNENVQRRFFSEMAGIVADLNPKQLFIFWCDADVQRVDEMDEPDDLMELHREINELGGAPGGGGTSFIPVFQKIEEMDIVPDLLVYLTDTAGSFPKQQPDYPVVWASIVENSSVPWGDLVYVEL